MLTTPTVSSVLSRHPRKLAYTLNSTQLAPLYHILLSVVTIKYNAGKFKSCDQAVKTHNAACLNVN